MKTRRVFKTVITTLFTMVLFLTFSASNAQTKHKHHTMKNGCMMKDGKMMSMKDGKVMPMNDNMMMKNGSKVMSNGECIMKDGSKMMMENGDQMDMNGVMHKNMKTKATGNKYTCPMHPEIKTAKGGKCPKCGMDLVKK